MAWRLWQQHRADNAESRAVRRYVRLRAAHRAWSEMINSAHRGADARLRLETALSALSPAPPSTRRNTFQK
jgi:hypothetical protein